jgi:hypothetical protein
MREMYRGEEWVLVKDNGSRDVYPIPKRLVSDGVSVIEDKPALAPNGKPVPPKNHSPLGSSSGNRRGGGREKSGAKSPGAEAGQTSANSKKE